MAVTKVQVRWRMVKYYYGLNLQKPDYAKKLIQISV